MWGPSVFPGADGSGAVFGELGAEHLDEDPHQQYARKKG